MHITIQKEALSAVVSLASLTTIKDASSIFSHLLITPDVARVLVQSTNQMTSTSSALHYTQIADKPRPFTVEADPFAKWLSNIEGEEVTLTVNADSVEAACGRSVSYFRTMRPESFPSSILSDSGELVGELDAGAFFDMLDYAKHGLPDTSGGDSKIKENMKLVRFRENSATATDSTVAFIVTSSALGEGVTLDLRIGASEVPSLLAFCKKVRGQKIKVLRTAAAVRFETADGSIFGFSEPSYDHVRDFRSMLDFDDSKQPILARLNLQEMSKAFKSVSASASPTSKSVVLTIQALSSVPAEGPVTGEIELTREGTSSKNINAAYFAAEFTQLKEDQIQYPVKIKLTLDQITKMLNVFGSQSGPVPVAVTLGNRTALRVSVMESSGAYKHFFCSFSLL